MMQEKSAHRAPIVSKGAAALAAAGAGIAVSSGKSKAPRGKLAMACSMHHYSAHENRAGTCHVRYCGLFLFFFLKGRRNISTHVSDKNALPGMQIRGV
jgi:hypothetical protein